MKKRIRALLVLCFILSSASVASADESDNETYFLYKESFDGSGISQFYRTSDKMEHYNHIPLPDDVLDQVTKSESQLLEAKKQMALRYVQADANERLSELFGLFDPDMMLADWKVDKDYESSFDDDSHSVVAYVEENRDNKVTFDTTDRMYQNYTDFVPKEFKRLHAHSFPSTDKLLKEHKESLFGQVVSGDQIYLFGGVLLLLIVVLVSYFLFRRR
jgi:hypothetical protein